MKLMRIEVLCLILVIALAGYSKNPPIVGTLRVHPENPRYFADSSGSDVYLTGSHTWSNFKDMGQTDPPGTFDYNGYLDFLQRYNHNFIRLWTWELSKYSYEGGKMTYAQPFPWQRTGPGKALDGKPKFDLTQFNQKYFDRLRSRVIAAGKRRIYVSIMFFEGHGLHASLPPWCWDGHPFNVKNNINGINGDLNGDGRGLETHTLKNTTVTSLQKAYVKKVIDTVNDLNNVLFEITNESGNYSTRWQYYMINFIHEYEKTKPKHLNETQVISLLRWCGYLSSKKPLSLTAKPKYPTWKSVSMCSGIRTIPRFPVSSLCCSVCRTIWARTLSRTPVLPISAERYSPMKKARN